MKMSQKTANSQQQLVKSPRRSLRLNTNNSVTPSRILTRRTSAGETTSNPSKLTKKRRLSDTEGYTPLKEEKETKRNLKKVFTTEDSAAKIRKVTSNEKKEINKCLFQEKKSTTRRGSMVPQDLKLVENESSRRITRSRARESFEDKNLPEQNKITSSIDKVSPNNVDTILTPIEEINEEEIVSDVNQLSDLNLRDKVDIVEESDGTKKEIQNLIFEESNKSKVNISPKKESEISELFSEEPSNLMTSTLSSHNDDSLHVPDNVISPLHNSKTEIENKSSNESSNPLKQKQKSEIQNDVKESIMQLGKSVEEIENKSPNELLNLLKQEKLIEEKKTDKNITDQNKIKETVSEEKIGTPIILDTSTENMKSCSVIVVNVEEEIKGKSEKKECILNTSTENLKSCSVIVVNVEKKIKGKSDKKECILRTSPRKNKGIKGSCFDKQCSVSCKSKEVQNFKEKHTELLEHFDKQNENSDYQCKSQLEVDDSKKFSLNAKTQNEFENKNLHEEYSSVVITMDSNTHPNAEACSLENEMICSNKTTNSESNTSGKNISNSENRKNEKGAHDVENKIVEKNCFVFHKNEMNEKMDEIKAIGNVELDVGQNSKELETIGINKMPNSGETCHSNFNTCCEAEKNVTEVNVNEFYSVSPSDLKIAEASPISEMNENCKNDEVMEKKQDDITENESSSGDNGEINEGVSVDEKSLGNMNEAYLREEVDNLKDFIISEKKNVKDSEIDEDSHSNLKHTGKVPNVENGEHSCAVDLKNTNGDFGVNKNTSANSSQTDLIENSSDLEGVEFSSNLSSEKKYYSEKLKNENHCTESNIDKIHEEPDINAKLDELLSKTQFSSDDDENENDLNPFFDNMAVEGEEDTPSEGSNDIVDVGEEINTTDSELSSDNDSYEDNSFIDDEENHELLSGEEFDLTLEQCKKQSRIIQLDSGSDEDIIRIVRPEKKKPIKRRKSRIIKVRDSSDEEIANAITETEFEEQENKNTGNTLEQVPLEIVSNNEFEQEQEINFGLNVNKKQLAEHESNQKREENDTHVGTNTSQNRNKKIIVHEDIIFQDIRNKPLYERAKDIKNLSLSQIEKENVSKKIIIQENIKVQDIQHKRLGERINQVLSSLCSQIKNTSEVSINVSVESINYSDTDDQNESEMEHPKSELNFKEGEKMSSKKFNQFVTSSPAVEAVKDNEQKQSKSCPKTKQKFNVACKENELTESIESHIEISGKKKKRKHQIPSAISDKILDEFENIEYVNTEDTALEVKRKKSKTHKKKKSFQDNDENLMSYKLDGKRKSINSVDSSKQFSADLLKSTEIIEENKNQVEKNTFKIKKAKKKKSSKKNIETEKYENRINDEEENGENITEKGKIKLKKRKHLSGNSLDEQNIIKTSNIHENITDDDIIKTTPKLSCNKKSLGKKNKKNKHTEINITETGIERKNENTEKNLENEIISKKSKKRKHLEYEDSIPHSDQSSNERIPKRKKKKRAQDKGKEYNEGSFTNKNDNVKRREPIVYDNKNLSVIDEAILEYRKKRISYNWENQELTQENWNVKNTTINPSQGNNVHSAEWKTLPCSQKHHKDILKKIHPKDFKNLMIYDPKRIRRMTTKKLLNQRSAIW